VNFTILSGPNAGLTGTGVTGATGETTFTYTDQGPVGTLGTDRIRANIGALLSNIAEMTWTPLNRAPVANPDVFTVDEDTVLTGNVVTNDTDEDGDAVTATLVSGPASGTLVFNSDGSFTYTPPLDFCGTDGFTYQLNDGTVDSNVASASITVACVNDAPVAGDDSNATDEDTPVGGSVSGNDSDADSATLTYGNASDPANGSVTLNGDGTYTYTPDLNFCGTDTFTYDASDGSLTDTATVTIVVACVNDAPVAADSAATTAEDTPLLASVSSTDVDGGAPTYAVISGPSHGTLVLNASTGAYTYTPNANYNGPDAFSFSVDDGAGGTDSGNVSITVTPVNDAPVCTAAAPSIGSLWPANHSLINVNVLGVTDPVEGSAITITITGIWQDEPTNTIGDGNTLIDGFGVGTSTAQVRAERSGAKRTPGDGRMYHIFFTGTDAEGGECTGSVKVGVPHDQGQDGTIGDGGPLYSSTGS
jgi:VCBS repeat-containing protein